MKGALKVENTGKLKYERRIENRLVVHGRLCPCDLDPNDAILADRVLGCCMAYGTVKAEIIADLIQEANAGLFKAYCNMCRTSTAGWRNPWVPQEISYSTG